MKDLICKMLTNELDVNSLPVAEVLEFNGLKITKLDRDKKRIEWIDKKLRQCLEYDECFEEEYDGALWELDEGLFAAVHRTEGGFLCGYVGVTKEYKEVWGVDYQNLEEVLDCHGGLTWSDFFAGALPESVRVWLEGSAVGLWWIGFDCAHSGDHVPGLAHHFVMFGKGGNQKGDVYRTTEYVEQEIENLRQQIRKLELRNNLVNAKTFQA